MRLLYEVHVASTRQAHGVPTLARARMRLLHSTVSYADVCACEHTAFHGKRAPVRFYIRSRMQMYVHASTWRARARTHASMHLLHEGLYVHAVLRRPFSRRNDSPRDHTGAHSQALRTLTHLVFLAPT